MPESQLPESQLSESQSLSFNLASLNTESLNSRQLLVDLHRISEIAQRFAGCLDPITIAKQTTDGLVQTFDCAFARIWLMEPNQTLLRLVASSGLYTHTDGSFAQVPVGAFKVGKIAQNRIPFLSNRLPDETWVKDRQWAMRHGITGFAGYPLVVADRVIGVLALFSYHPLSSEFLEVLQGLCTTVALVLDTALHYQHERQSESTLHLLNPTLPLSEQLAAQLSTARFTLVGTERSLSPILTHVLLRLAEGLRELNCTYCRLNYEDDRITVEAMLMPAESTSSALGHPVTNQVNDRLVAQFGDLFFPVTCLSGDLQIITGTTKVVQVTLQLPYFTATIPLALRVRLTAPALQLAFVQLAYLAKLTVCNTDDARICLLTDDVNQLAPNQRVLWLQHPASSLPKGIMGRIDVSTNANQLREAVAAIDRGKSWGLSQPDTTETPSLSEREQEIMQLVARGLRDREIAAQLYISERTVKFHINNILTKLNAKTRCQAIYTMLTQ